MLGGPDLAWLVGRLARRIERGQPLTGTLTLPAATDAQRRAAQRLLGRSPGRGASVSIRIDALAAQLAAAGVAADLRAAVEVLCGSLPDLAGQRARADAERGVVLEVLRAGRHAGVDWYDRWVDAFTVDGTLTRWLRRGDAPVVGHAVQVLDRLPVAGTPLPLPVLAERAVGDTKALSGTPLARLVLRALAARAGLAQPPRDQIGQRGLWESAGVVADDLASQVLVLNVTATDDHVVAGWLRDAAAAGLPFRLTLHQLTVHPVTPPGTDVYVCENPAVLRVAAAELGRHCAPLVCTEGQPSAACLTLVAAAAAAGATLHWRGDFDWAGVRMTAEAVTRFGARPWRMSAADYGKALAEGDSERLTGAAAPTPWDPALAEQLRVSGHAVMEERLLPTLLADLG